MDPDEELFTGRVSEQRLGRKAVKKLQQLFTSRGRCSCPSVAWDGRQQQQAICIFHSLLWVCLGCITRLYTHSIVHTSKVEVTYYCVCILLYADIMRDQKSMSSLFCLSLYIGQTQTCKCKRPTRRRLSLFHLVCLSIRGFTSLLGSCSISLRMSTLMGFRT